jgi:hypothetical protein
MADLMMVAGKDIEGAVQRLAQMARAAGLHVVLGLARCGVPFVCGAVVAWATADGEACAAGSAGTRTAINAPRRAARPAAMCHSNLRCMSSATVRLWRFRGLCAYSAHLRGRSPILNRALPPGFRASRRGWPGRRCLPCPSVP